VRGKRILVFLLVLGTVVLLNLPLPASLRIKASARDNFLPFQNVMSLVLVRAGELGRTLGDARRAMEVQQDRIGEIAELRSEVRLLRSLARENDELRDALGFARRRSLRLIPCRVVLRGDAAGWWQKVTVNRGARHGVRPDLAVISRDGLVGRTTVVSRHTAEVLLITDPQCRVSCRFSRTRASGVLRGGGVALDGSAGLDLLAPLRPCRADYIEGAYELREGDEVTTSGLGGVFPGGLLIGTVVRTELDESGLYQRADVTPAADLTGLRYVFIVGGKERE